MRAIIFLETKVNFMMYNSRLSVRKRAEHIQHLINSAEKAGIEVVIKVPKLLN